MSSTLIGAGSPALAEVSGAGPLRSVAVPEIVLEAWRRLARERGLSEVELWGSFWTFALENGGQRARLLLAQAEEDVASEVVQVRDTEAWVSSVLASGFLPVRRDGGMLSVVAPAPRVPVSEARRALEEALQGAAS